MIRSKWIAGSVILAVVMILLFGGSLVLLKKWDSRQGQVGQREPLPSLRYCSSRQVEPCILSFNLDSDGTMVIHLLIENSSPPDFYLKIRQAGRESIYKCRKVKGFSNNISCTGEAMPVGEVLQFLLISTDGNTPLAEGTFPIIGLALATPEIAPTATASTPLTPASTDQETPTPEPIFP